MALAGDSDLIARWGAYSLPYRLFSPSGVFGQWSAGWTETLQGGMGGPPWADPARYIRNSPLMAAGRITTPLLLIDGDQDIGQPTQSGLMFSALYRQNKDALLATYWGRGALGRQSGCYPRPLAPRLRLPG